MRKYQVLKVGKTVDGVLCAECDSIEFATTAADKLAQELKGNEDYERVIIKELKSGKYKDVGNIYIEIKEKENDK